MRIVAGIHEPFAAELIDDREQVLIAFKAAQDSALKNIVIRFMDSAGQFVGFSSPVALFTVGARLENMLDMFSDPPIPIRQLSQGDPLDWHCSELSDGSDKNAFAGLCCRVMAQRCESPDCVLTIAERSVDTLLSFLSIDPPSWRPLGQTYRRLAPRPRWADKCPGG